MKGKRRDGSEYYITCNIMRIVEITSIDPTTWAELGKRIETKECGAPLFGDASNTGICRSCREGWEVEGNAFASPDERERAMKS